MINLVLKDDVNEGPIYMRLYEKVKVEIERRRLKPDEKLPSIRTLSKELDLSRTTVENAYNQLLMEGYIYSKPQSGYYVSYIDNSLLNNDDVSLMKSKEEELSTTMEGFVDKSLFNFSLWKKNISRAINEYEEELYQKVDHQGEFLLRKEICHYIYKYRGVKCSPEQVVIGAGVQILLNILCHLLKIKGYDEAAFENPGFMEPHHIFLNNGLKLNHIPVKQEGIDIEKLINSKSNVCYVSPSHQFPTGAIMPIYKRVQLIKWAREGKNLIIEDDYDSELIYSGQPIPSLQGLDEGNNVIYLGSFSTIFMPAVRVSYMVLPESLMDDFYAIRSSYSPTVSKLEQLTLSEFMRSGDFEKHIRRVKNILAKKNKHLIHMIKEELSPYVTITSGDIGVYLILKIKDTQKVEHLIKHCERNKIPLNPLSNYTIDKNNFKDIVIFMYRDIPMDDIVTVVMDIKKCL